MTSNLYFTGMRIALSVMRDEKMLNELLLKMNNDDYSHLLDVHHHSNGETDSEDGHNRMGQQIKGMVPGLIQDNPNMLNNINGKAKNKIVKKKLFKLLVHIDCNYCYTCVQ